MQQYKCLIIEDEPLAAEVLQDYVSQVPFLELKGICSDAIYAMEALQQQQIDLIFLDIHLPKLKGLDFIKTIKEPPQVIITTAYPEYAVKGYEYNVLDYLLKPIEFSRFLTAVNKLRSKTAVGTQPEAEHIDRESIFFNTNKKMVRVFLDEILYIESLKEYVRVVTQSKTIVTKFQLGQIENVLLKKHFLRIHRSYIISKEKIDAYTATDVEISGKLIPIGRGYKDAFIEELDKSGRK